MESAPVNWLNVLGALSRNAKLYLGFCAFVGGIIPGGIVLGIWATLFNLYLLQIGLGKDLIGLIIQMEFLGHGLLVFPFAILSDIIGHKKIFYLSMMIAILAIGAMLFETSPLLLLMFAFALGVGRGAHAVVGSPFMVANSEPRDRAHLYSLSQMISQLLFMVGAFSAGFVPLALTARLGIFASPEDAYREILLLTLPLMALSLLPIRLIKKRPDEYPQKASLRNISSHAVIGVLVLTQGLYALGFAFVQPLLNVFFAEKFDASTEQVSLVFSLGALVATFSALATPTLVNRLGRVRAVVVAQIMASFFYVAMPFMVSLGAVAALYFLRQMTFSMSAPIRQMFSMEVVQVRERASTEGLLHFVFDVSAAVPAALAGAMMMRSDYASPFVIGGVLQLVAAVAFLRYFIEKARPKEVTSLPSLVSVR